MQRWLERQWYKNTSRLTVWLNFPLGCLFIALLAFRHFLYRIGILGSWRSPVPVIVVGNITVGGTGKTPLVIWLANQLKACGYTPGIISRGYKGAAKAPKEVLGADLASLVGDEPLLMARRTSCSVWIGKDRPAAARELLKAHPECDVIISDDGLQHYALQRDFEIVVIDGARRYGNKLMLPFGPMREPLSRLRFVDAVVVNGLGPVKASEFQMQLSGDLFYSLLSPEKTVRADYFHNKKIHAVAGIGNPSRFFNYLRGLCLDIVEHPFSDHHQFQTADLQIPGADIILMTEKDAVKCLDFARDNVWVLPVEARVSGGLEDKVIEKIESFYGR
jgi:tetraacyldisaccharide 4'-kinase